MRLTAQNGSNKNKNDYPTEGTKLARLVGITDLGHQPGFEYQGEQVKSQFKITLTYELPTSFTEDGRPHWVSEDVNVSDFVGDGIMSKMMKRVYALDPDGSISGHGKDLTKLIGMPCMVSIKYNAKGYPQIKDAVPSPEGMPIAELQNDPQIFDMDNPDMELFNKFPTFMQNKIKSALDFEETQLYKELLVSDSSGVVGDEGEY